MNGKKNDADAQRCCEDAVSDRNEFIPCLRCVRPWDRIDSDKAGLLPGLEVNLQGGCHDDFRFRPLSRCVGGDLDSANAAELL